MKIDTHQHFWRYRATDFPWISDAMVPLKKNCVPADCEAALNVCQVDRVIAVQARASTDETDFLLELAQTNLTIAGVVGWVDLEQADVATQLDRWTDKPALRGFRHILQDEAEIKTIVEGAAFNRGVSLLQSRKLVYDVLVFAHQLAGMENFCRRHDQHWLVLDHLGKPPVRDWTNRSYLDAGWIACMRELAAMPHVMCKLSGLVTETNWATQSEVSNADVVVMHACFDAALDAFGPQRILFGSDWPVCQLAAPYESVHAIAQTWAHVRLSESEQQDFWGGNALRCYGLKPVQA